MGDSSFAMALVSAPHLLVIVDDKFSLPDRAWCVFEIGTAAYAGRDVSVRFCRKPDLEKLSAKVSGLDVETTVSTSDPADLEMIRDTILQGGDFTEFNRKVKQTLVNSLLQYKTLCNDLVPRGKYKAHDAASESQSARKLMGEDDTIGVDCKLMGEDDTIGTDVATLMAKAVDPPKAAFKLGDKVNRMQEGAPTSEIADGVQREVHA